MKYFKYQNTENVSVDLCPAKGGTVAAQSLYNWAEKGNCAGEDLHRFFEAVTGTPSPSGRVAINAAYARQFKALMGQGFITCK